jgi:hypothetical protein
MSSDSTSISDLPVGGPMPAVSDSLDQSTISLLVNGLQQVKSTQLPSRDIPITTEGLSNDVQTQPNYVPSPETEDYIGDYEIPRDNKNGDSLDDMYSELQTPILLAVLYFLFQLPIFKKHLFNYFPILFANDGNLNISGFLFNSALFAMIFYMIHKVTKY